MRAQASTHGRLDVRFGGIDQADGAAGKSGQRATTGLVSRPSEQRALLALLDQCFSG